MGAREEHGIDGLPSASAQQVLGSDLCGLEDGYVLEPIDPVDVALIDPVDVECGGTDSFCDARLPIAFHNCTDDPIELEEIRVIQDSGPTWAYTFFEEILEPSTVYTRDRWVGARLWRVEVDVLTNDGPELAATGTFRVTDTALEAALEACDACEGVLLSRSVCNCRLPDVGEPCSANAQCLGRCLFDHWETESLGADGTLYTPQGLCSEYRNVQGCHAFINANTLPVLSDADVPPRLITVCICRP